MKKTLLTMLLALSFSFIFANQASAAETDLVPESSTITQDTEDLSVTPFVAAVGYITGDGVRLRSSPGLSGTILGVLYIGDSIALPTVATRTVDGIEWRYIESDRLGINGWVANMYVKETPV